MGLHKRNAGKWAEKQIAEPENMNVDAENKNIATVEEKKPVASAS